ncbi:hypothetical protein D6745_02490 [Candidatus Woesearchaeota archaeon]|nr:MAG: hypothetical protein D6745_02490 [Candidatus Woesearchaeota archaeon]
MNKKHHCIICEDPEAFFADIPSEEDIDDIILRDLAKTTGIDYNPIRSIYDAGVPVSELLKITDDTEIVAHENGYDPNDLLGFFSSLYPYCDTSPLNILLLYPVEKEGYTIIHDGIKRIDDDDDNSVHIDTLTTLLNKGVSVGNIVGLLNVVAQNQDLVQQVALDYETRRNPYFDEEDPYSTDRSFDDLVLVAARFMKEKNLGVKELPGAMEDAIDIKAVGF